MNADLMEKLRLVWESYKKLNYNYNAEFASDSDNQVYFLSLLEFN